MRSILVVCVGNICRSPMAEALLARALPTAQVCSAGLDAMSGHAAALFSQQIMQELGIDISRHRARQLSAALVMQADLVLAMDARQCRFIEQKYPAVKGKVMRLGEFCDVDIPDPHRQDIDAFRHSFALISQAVDALRRRLQGLS